MIVRDPAVTDAHAVLVNRWTAPSVTSVHLLLSTPSSLIDGRHGFHFTHRFMDVQFSLVHFINLNLIRRTTIYPLGVRPRNLLPGMIVRDPAVTDAHAVLAIPEACDRFG